ncbi:hypothetical protein [Hymenobacter persicinus]|uniref:Uncharacterized protein n=1 Tax=Hymenobacter persicinus TaxID=2025506 RepID=A0A4Q5L6L1_9BACT|nr:hypothetical protein [Hymenobacter persicinus]RYU75616.1 hypothetical protein EWM57_19740 [Hymenobacter persicinus]
MEKVQMLLLILFGVVVFVWRLVQKARETMAQESRTRPGNQGPPAPGTSFQELLKQMQAQNAARSADPTATVPAPAARKPRQAKPLAAPTPPVERPAPRRPATPRAPLQTTPEAPNAVQRRVADMLRNPADVRAAFVLSEILQRKF